MSGEVTARDYLADARSAAVNGRPREALDALIAAVADMLDMLAPATFVPLRPPGGVNPLELIVCCNPNCAHAAVFHGMRWDSRTGAIELGDPDMACATEGCPCDAWDQGEMPTISADLLARPGEQG